MTSSTETYCRDHAKKLDELHVDVRALAEFIPDIKVAMEKLLNVQNILSAHSEVHKEMFSVLRRQSDDITELRVKQTDIGGRLGMLEESRKGLLGIVSPVWSAIILGVFVIILWMMIKHNMLPVQITGS